MSSPKLGVLVLHGIGSQPADFAEPFIEKLRKRLRAAGHRDDDVAWQPVHWAPDLEQREAALLRRMHRAGRLRWKTLRAFIVHTLADALAYQPSPHRRDRVDVYEVIHRRLEQDVRALRAALRHGREDHEPDPPLIVMAHSLGCHIVSNYIWDARRRSDRPPLERMETVAAIVFFGCNIPLFSLAHRHFHPIVFPHPNLAAHFPPGTPPAALAKAAVWKNFYDPDDVLGWPLRTLSEEYASCVVEDVPVDAGFFPLSATPMSHTAYWTDGSFVKRVARVLNGVLRLL